METPDEETEAQERKIEELLLKNCRWAIRAARIVGYFPFTVHRGKTLKWNPCSVSTAFSTVVFAAGVAWLHPYHALLPVMEKILRLRSPTERFANALLSYAQQAISQTFRVRHVLNAKTLLKFWKSNLRTLTLLSRTKYLNFFDSENHFEQLFLNVGRQTRNTVFAYWFAATIQFTTMTILLPDEPVLKITLAFWCYTLYFHPGYSVWAAYFPRIYALAFKVIRHQLDSISLRREKIEGSKAVSQHRVFGGFDCLKAELSAESKVVTACSRARGIIANLLINS